MVQLYTVSRRGEKVLRAGFGDKGVENRERTNQSLFIDVKENNGHDNNHDN